ncbi:hypothetical protein BJ165DRAFT_1486892 [Panaeolus papilionaceus]|nr:hypothetical protein BJ165DRAFT_1486892 [Panaeolus papilionaceus]
MPPYISADVPPGVLAPYFRLHAPYIRPHAPNIGLHAPGSSPPTPVYCTSQTPHLRNLHVSYHYHTHIPHMMPLLLYLAQSEYISI